MLESRSRTGTIEQKKGNSGQMEKGAEGRETLAIDWHYNAGSE